MKLRGRLIIAFFTVTMLPILAIAFAGVTIIKVQMNSIEQSFRIDSDTLQVLANPIQLLNRVTRGVYNEIKLCALKTPEKLEDVAFYERLTKELEGKSSYIVVRKADNIIYSGNPDAMGGMESKLPKFGNYSTEADGGIYYGGKNPFLLKQQDFYFGDYAEGSIFVVTEVNTLIPQIKSSAIQLGGSVIVILAITAMLLTLWIYRSIIRPLGTLRMATNRMKEGDLNFVVRVDNKDEIGELCQDFDNMRIRLKELLEEKVQYETDSKELISNISHDLKTPITAIKGYAEGIIDGVADTTEKRERYLRTIYTKACDMTTLVDELSLYSRLDSNNIPYNFTNINLNQYFQDCISEISLDLEVKQIDIAYFPYINKHQKIIADPEQLKRVINNIVNNAVKYRSKDRKGIICIRTQEKGDYVSIEIEDNGNGIAKNEVGLIFDRFYRADASRNSSKGGSGLGLSIAKKIIEEHGGRIWAESTAGVGTTITFLIRKSRLEQEQMEEAVAAEENTGDKAKVSGFISRLVK